MAPRSINSALRAALVGAFALALGCGGIEPLPPAENEAPVAHLRAPVIAPVGQAITLDASQSFDPNTGPLNYRFDFAGFISGEATLSPVLSSNPVVSVALPAQGLYTVHLLVTDLHGATASAIQDITAREDYPDPPAFCVVASDCPVGDECTEGVCYANGGGLFD